MPEQTQQEPTKPLTVSEAGKLGGLKTAELHGKDHYKRIGTLGGNRLRELVKAGKRAQAGEGGA